MKNLKNLLTIPLQVPRLHKWIPIVLITLAFIGFSDAIYLTVEHFQNKIPPCAIGGCESVLTSSYSQIIGMPVSLLGSIYYFILIILLFIFFDTKKEIFLRLHSIISVFGFIASISFMYIMIFIIKSFCPYCVISASVSIITFLIVIWMQYLSLKAE